MVAALSVDITVRRIDSNYQKYKLNKVDIPNSNHYYCIYTTFHLDDQTLSSVCLATAITEIKNSAFEYSPMTAIFIPG